MQKQIYRFSKPLFWLLLLLWLVSYFPALAAQEAKGQTPIDFLSYQRAAEALAQGNNPYVSRAESLRIWRSFHADEAALLAAPSPQDAQALLQEQQARPQQPGPYLYPPTLALLIQQFHISPLIFASLILVSIFGFAWLWLRHTGIHPVWLLLIAFSWDVLTGLHAGNVELGLLGLSLLACWLMWKGWGLVAALPIALVVLIKPFYLLLFIAFGPLWLVSHPEQTKNTGRLLVTTGGITLLLVILEALRWEAGLRAAALEYLSHAADYQWFVLPMAEQTPMSIWNRTPFQGLVSAGVPLGWAQPLALGLWGLFLIVTLWRVRNARLPFAWVFALAFVLLYWGRPVGWGLPYLEIVAVGILWPRLPFTQRGVLLGLVLALMASHWYALILTAQGYGMPLLTLQSADWPWETWLVLPLIWLGMMGRAEPPQPEVVHRGDSCAYQLSTKM